MKCPVLFKHRLKMYSYNEICCLVLLMMSDSEQAVARCEIMERGEVTGPGEGQQNMSRIISLPSCMHECLRAKWTPCKVAGPQPFCWSTTTKAVISLRAPLHRSYGSLPRAGIEGSGCE